MEDRDCALFAKLEGDVRRDVKTFRVVVRSDGRAVVLACVGARNVEPVSSHVNGFTEVDGNGGVIRHIETLGNRISIGDPWTKLDNRRRATRIRRAGLEVVAVLIRVLTTVLFTEQCGRVAWRRRTRAPFETARTRTVADEVDDVRISAIRTTAAQ